MRLRHPLADAAVRRVTETAGRRADGSPLKLDLSFPPDMGPAGRPATLLVHGALPDGMGGTMREHEMYRGWGAALAAAGSVGLMLDHSLDWPRLDLDRALAEIDQVLNWVSMEGPGRGIDASRLTAILVSAGGVLAAELLIGARPLPVRGASLFSPLVDAPSAAGTSRRHSLADAAPRIAAGGKRLQILRAGGDAPGLLQMLDRAVAALLAADADLEVHNLPSAPHCYEVHLDTPQVRAQIDRALQFAARGGDVV